VPEAPNGHRADRRAPDQAQPSAASHDRACLGSSSPTRLAFVGVEDALAKSCRSTAPKRKSLVRPEIRQELQDDASRNERRQFVHETVPGGRTEERYLERWPCGPRRRRKSIDGCLDVATLECALCPQSRQGRSSVGDSGKKRPKRIVAHRVLEPLPRVALLLKSGGYFGWRVQKQNVADSSCNARCRTGWRPQRIVGRARIGSCQAVGVRSRVRKPTFLDSAKIFTVCLAESSPRVASSSIPSVSARSRLCRLEGRRRRFLGRG
jgi:hypothetical protein